MYYLNAVKNVDYRKRPQHLQEEQVKCYNNNVIFYNNKLLFYSLFLALKNDKIIEKDNTFTRKIG